MNTNSKSYHARLTQLASKNTFQARARLMARIRQLLDDRGFIEIDTPVLYPYPEIAPMEQFKVLDPTSNRSYYLRVCPTEHLKRLMVAGFEKVYEFSRNFRPGNRSPKHSAEFTSLECSQLSVNYHSMMELTESIVSRVISEIKEAAWVEFNGAKFDVSPPWQKVTVRDAIWEAARVDVLAVESLEELRRNVNQYDLVDIQSIDQAIDRLVEVAVLPTLSRPTFLTEYPYELGGPAQPLRTNAKVKERCEAFIGTLEIANMSTHLNDLQKLREWHERTLEIKRSLGIGDAALDEPLFESLSYGLPESAVVGIGIDRLTMLATGASSIEDVILFPFDLM